MAAYVILGISCEGKKDVLKIEVGDNESAKYWLAVLNSLKNRGVKDILIISADGLTGIREAIQTAFLKTEFQRCIVRQVRNTLKYVSDKDRKAFANDLKTIYNASNEEQGRANRDRITEKWSENISERHETLGTRLGCHHSDLQVFRKCENRHLHDERDREFERHIPQAESSEKRFPQCPGSSEGPVSGHL